MEIEEAAAQVLATTVGRLPGRTSSPAPAYLALARALDQLGRLGDLED